MKFQSFVFTVAVFVVALMSAACRPTVDWENFVGQRFLSFQIEVDGDVRYTGSQSVNDNALPAEVWDVIGTVEFEPAESGDAEDHVVGRMSRTISGTVVVRFGYDNYGDERTIDSLSLQSENGGNSWSLSQSEVDRLRAANSSE